MSAPPNQKMGRNDPCPCGSGRKYKRCCLQTQKVSDDPWQRQHEVSAALTREMIEFAARQFGGCIEEAWQDFNMTDFAPSFVDPHSEGPIFMPYYLFDWDPDPPVTKGVRPGRGVILEAFRTRKAARISDLEQQFLDQAARPLSFYDVLWSKPGEGIGCRDILTAEETEVVEHAASQALAQGDVIYAQLWSVTGLNVLGRCSGLRIPPGRKAAVIDLRRKLQRRVRERKLTAPDLIRATRDIRETYLDVRDALYTPPRLCNTDGDPLVFHTLTFKITSPGFAFDALAPLAVGRSKEDLLLDAKFDASGHLVRVEFPWMRLGYKRMPTWDNTILGHIKISGHRLVAEANSERRAQRLRQEIEKRLGIAATHQQTTSQTVEDALDKLPDRDRAEVDDRERKLLQDPEVRRHFQETMQAQMEAWVHQKVPILKNRTPLEAVRDPDGREVVESLLLDWERHKRQPGIHLDFDVVRKLLSLPVAGS